VGILEVAGWRLKQYVMTVTPENFRTNARPGSITYSTVRGMTSRPTYRMGSHGFDPEK